MTISTHSLINTQVRKIDGLSIRYAESGARDPGKYRGSSY